MRRLVCVPDHFYNGVGRQPRKRLGVIVDNGNRNEALLSHYSDNQVYNRNTGLYEYDGMRLVPHNYWPRWCWGKQQVVIKQVKP